MQFVWRNGQHHWLAACATNLRGERITIRIANLSGARRSGYLDKFIHAFGHFVGLDVHDAGLYDAPLPPGAVFTVEPGVYLPERGFGVRIEDQVLMLGNGKWRLLTAEFPRKLEDVEAWVAAARR